MHWIRMIGLRYLLAKKSQRFLGFIAALSFLGVAIGVGATLIVLAVMHGFQEEMTERLLKTDLHLLITPSADLAAVSDRRALSLTEGQKREIEALRTQAESVTPVLLTEVVLQHGDRVTGVEVKGVPAERIERLKSHLVETRQTATQGDDPLGVVPPPPIWLGKEMAFTLSAVPGDTVTLLSPIETDGPLGSVPRMRAFRVEGVYSLGLPDQEAQVAFVPLKDMESFLKVRGAISQWEVTLRDPRLAMELSAGLRDRLPGFLVRDWTDLNGALFHSLALERTVMTIILLFVVVVASFNIVSSLMLLVAEKQRELAILRSFGASESDLSKIFIVTGLLLGGGGATLGVGLAVAAGMFLRWAPIVRLPDLYVDRTIPVAFPMWASFGVVAIALVVVMLASVIPARRAAKIKILDGLNH